MADEKAQEKAAKEKDAEKTAQEAGMSRRGLLRNVMWASAGLFAVQASVTGFAMFWPRKVEGFGAQMDLGPLDDFAPNSVTRFRDGRLFLSRLGEDSIIALYWRCPHLGCTVPWVEGDGQFRCPCHGSVYDRTGQNIAGPAPRPMDFMNVDIVNGRVIVDTGAITERPRHRPEHETGV